IRSQSSAEELVTSGDRHPVHVPEDLVDADAGPGVGIRRARLVRDETQPRVSRTAFDLGAAQEHAGVAAPAAGLPALLVVLSDDADLGVIGEQGVVDALRLTAVGHVDSTPLLFVV